ncbi:4Fe-4S binding protein (plasmid) [Microvirga terrae]|uniref:4Fe-4S binding protein n=1 Tax=Microvirga terrae TaxID=2740529 RepID=A0ABY5RY29_9HYPH|nr:4Fe-4S binding protein [Microvirga terrae]UVF22180.1 4Fe-4S binding protein [Microvirga terrae]
MPLDKAALERGCGGKLEFANQLCRKELDRFRAVVSSSEQTVVGCAQEAPLFAQTAAVSGSQSKVVCANVRETAGWSEDAASAGPKMAAILASAAEELPPIPLVTLTSSGVALVYGNGELAISIATRISEQLDVTVLLSDGSDTVPARVNEFPILSGTITSAKGHLGAFHLCVDDCAVALPSSRSKLMFGPARSGVISKCDIIIDVSGGPPLFSAHELRLGYLRAEPLDQVAVERALFEAVQLVGDFDKPQFVDFRAELCAHSRSHITGCTRCLDICPTGAISPAGDHIEINHNICAGCGNCASVCPTGAAAYTLPPSDALIQKLRRLVLAFHAAGGRDAVILFHDSGHGEPLIDALARFREGLPANVLPVKVHEVGQVGLEVIAALFAYGVCAVRFLVHARPRYGIEALRQTISTADALLRSLGYGARDGSPVVGVVETDDPDELSSQLVNGPLGTPPPVPATFLPSGRKRHVLEFSLQELRRFAPRPIEQVPLEPGASFGGIDVDGGRCTLCLSCVTACPTHALSDNSERPMLRFTEALCVQCGLCAATCPEDAIELVPRIDFAAWGAPARIMKQEEPFCCVKCGNAFGTRSSIERVITRLQAGHWMFSGIEGEGRLNMLRMCDHCRAEDIANSGFDAHKVESDMHRPNGDKIGN